MIKLTGKDLPYTQEELDTAEIALWKSKHGTNMATVCIGRKEIIKDKPNWHWKEHFQDLVCALNNTATIGRLLYVSEGEKKYTFVVISSKRWLGNERRSPERRIRIDRRKPNVST